MARLLNTSKTFQLTAGTRRKAVMYGDMGPKAVYDVVGVIFSFELRNEVAFASYMGEVK
jgi:hypothetical protein